MSVELKAIIRRKCDSLLLNHVTALFTPASELCALGPYVPSSSGKSPLGLGISSLAAASSGHAAPGQDDGGSTQAAIKVEEGEGGWWWW